MTDSAADSVCGPKRCSNALDFGFGEGRRAAHGRDHRADGRGWETPQNAGVGPIQCLRHFVHAVLNDATKLYEAIVIQAPWILACPHEQVRTKMPFGVDAQEP